MPRMKAEKTEAVEEKIEETLDTTPDEQKEAALSEAKTREEGPRDSERGYLEKGSTFGM